MKIKAKIKLKPYLPYIALFAINFIWGLNYVVAKVTLTEIPVMSLSFIRFIAALFLMAPVIFVLKKHHYKFKGADIPSFILSGLFMITFNIALMYEGLTLTSAIDASVISLVIPILSVVASWLFLKERIYFINFMGIIIAFLGSILILGFPLILVNGYNAQNTLGNLMILAASVSFVIGSLLSKKLLRSYPPVVLTLFMFAIGAVTFLLPALNEYNQNPDWVKHVSILGSLGFLYITFLSTVSSYFLLNWALSKIDLNKANFFQYLEPVVAATFAVPLLSERISFSFIISTCLIILGVYWGTLGKPDHHHIHHRSHHI